MAVETGEGDRAVGHRQLPRADHLVARRQAADGTVPDRDEEALGGDGRMREHAQRGFAQVEPAPLQRGPLRWCRMLRVGQPSKRRIGG